MSRNLVIALVLATSDLTYADEATARVRYTDAERAYSAGQFDKAIELFQQAYDEQPDPAFIFNIAQAYRKQGACKQAKTFYQRYLAQASIDPTKPIKPEIKSEVEGQIAALKCATEDHANAEADAEAEADADAEPPVAAEAGPRFLDVHAGIGVAKIAAGGLDSPIQLAIAAVAGYPIPLGERASLVVGAAVTFTPLPYTAMTGTGVGWLFAIAADAGGVYAVMPELSARIDLGVGMEVIGGLDKPGNPFTVGGASVNGALATPVARFAVSADYAITPDVSISATPLSIAYAPAPSGFLSSSLTAVSFLIGVGFRH